MTGTEIQVALTSYFKAEGYQTWCPENKYSPAPNIVAYHPDRHHLWIIEAKGDHANSAGQRVAFEGALGQVCQRVAGQCKQKINEELLLPTDIVTYGLAFPEGKGYRALCQQIRQEVRLALSLYLFFVRPDNPSPTI